MRNKTRKNCKEILAKVYRILYITSKMFHNFHRGGITQMIRKILLTAVFAITTSAFAAVYYVDGANGSDSNDGRGEKKSFRTIQKAADKVVAGDTVVISPGVYFEIVRLNRSGAPGKYITFRGRGEVIITAADRTLREKRGEWKLEDREKNLYSVSFDHEPSRVLADGYELFPYASLGFLKRAELSDAGYPAPPHGFCFDGKRLYVRFREGQSPEKTLLCVSPSGAKGSNAHHVWQAEHSNFHIGKNAAKRGYIKLENLTFETPGTAGVVTYASNVAVTGCSFHGCRFGVAGVRKAANVFVESCFYTQKGVHSDTMELIRRAQRSGINKKIRFYFWAHKINRNSKKQMVNFETGIVCGVGRNWHIRNCRIDDSFEGFSTWGASNAEDFQVYGNVFRKIVDNAAETENSSRNVRIYNNFFEDVFEPVSWQPLAGPPWPGPVFVYRNVVKTTPDFKLHAEALENFLPGVFKLGVSGRNWQYPQHGNVPVSVIAARTSKRFVGAPDPGFLVFNNTIIHPDGGLMTTPQPLDDRALRELVNFRFFNNIILTKKMHVSKTWKAPLVEFYSNIVIDSPHNDFHRGIMNKEGGKLLKDASTLSMNSDWTLTEKSPARNGGILHFFEPDASTDCGAVPYGEKFEMVSGTEYIPELDKLTPFRRAVYYHPELLRSAGPEAGSWAVYSFDKAYKIPLAVPAGAKRFRAVFRLADCTRPHERSIVRKWKLFAAKNYSISLEAKEGKAVLICRSGGGESRYDLGAFNRDRYCTLDITFGNSIEFDGRGISGKAPAAPAPGKGELEIFRNVLFDASFAR